MTPEMAKKFKDFYEAENIGIPFTVFIGLSITLQLGIFIKFFDTVYGYGIVFDRYSYAIFSSEPAINGWQNIRECVASEYFKRKPDIIDNGELAILRIIELIKVPF